MPERKKLVVEKKPELSKEYLNFLLDEQKAKEAKSLYEKYCRFFGFLKIRPPEPLSRNLQEKIVFSTLNVTPTDVFSSTIITFLLVMVVNFTLSYLLNSAAVVLIMTLLPFIISYFILSYPTFRAQVLKVQTGGEAIKIILYMVIYLKLHPSFEGAINFTTSRVKGPISTDMRKAMWDLHTGKYKTIEETLAFYMPKWAIWNEDFVRALSLLHTVLIEPSERGRDSILRKSLSFLLTNTETKMKNYVENITGPINILYFLGMLMPVMGLIMFPMVSLFLYESINPIYIGLCYTVMLPLLILFFMNRILLKRPSAFIIPEISKHPDLPPKNTFLVRLGNRKFFVPIIPVTLMVGFLIMTYGILHFIDLYSNLWVASPGLKIDILKKEAEMSFSNLMATYSITGGVGAIVFLYFYLRSFQRIKIRNDIKNIEDEFQIGLFTLGNYLSEGYPIEASIQKSLDEYKKIGMEKRPTYYFLSRLLSNIKNFGMTFKRAIFDEDLGIIRHFPSVLIEEVMRVLSDAAEAGSEILGGVSKTIASYLESLKKIEAKIRELMEDVRSSIKMQSTFTIPFISAIVGSLGIFMVNMLKLLSCELQQIEKSIGMDFLRSGTQTAGFLLNQLVGDFTRVIPMTVLQVIVGIYTVEIVALFASLLNGIENGFDKTSRDYLIADTLIKALLIYGVVTFFALFFTRGLMASIIESGATLVCD